MNSRDVEPLADELRSLLSAERERDGMPSDAQARLAHRLGIVPGGGGGGPDAASPGRPSPRIVNPPPRWFARPRFLGPMTFALGLAGGAILHDLNDRRVSHDPIVVAPAVEEMIAKPAVSPVVNPAVNTVVNPAVNTVVNPAVSAVVNPAVNTVVNPAVNAVVNPAVSPEVPLAASPTGSAIGARHHSSSTPHADPRGEVEEAAPSGRDADLAAERAFLEIARTSLGRGRNQQAIASLSQHAKRFPNGQLAEERDSLWVQALVQAGHDREARERGERFRREHPESFLLRAVDDALRSIP